MQWSARVLASCLALSVCSCANLTTLDRDTRYPVGITATNGERSEAKNGLAIHLDVKQRIAYTNGRVFCAEPSPDALTSAAASVGGGISLPTQGAGSLAGALQENAASIGLRTQSITLMRDALYRVCEAYHNGALGKADVVQLLQRAQDLTLGVLAIEQLTGAVAARQVVLTGSSNASASANLASTQETLNSARRFEKSKKADLDAAEAAEKKQNQKVVDIQTEIADAKKNNKDTTTLDKQLTAAQEELESKKTAKADATRDYEQAKDVSRRIEDNLFSSFSSASASASGGGNFGDELGRVTLDGESTTAIASAVETVVSTVVNKGHVTDTCINFLSDAGAKSQLTAHAKGIVETCKDVIQRTLAVYEKLALAQAKVIEEAAKAAQTQKTPNQKAPAALSPFMRQIPLQ